MAPAATASNKNGDVNDDEPDGEYEESDNEDPNVFKIRDFLNPPSAKIYTTHDLHNLIHEGTIDLNPPYQRDVVWPESKQIGLIDSIFRNFYIPPIVFAVQKDDEGEDVRVCVDGKQRLTSIQKFFDGQIPHRDNKTKKSFWYTRSDTQKGIRLDIPDEWKAVFSKKEITCVEYTNLAPGTERDIFQRVQLGMTLTAAEKLQAIASPWAEWISDLEAQHVSSEGGLSQVLQWDTKRGRDFQCVAQMIYCCDSLPVQQVPSAPKLEKWMTRVDPPTPTFKSTIHHVLQEFWNFATDNKLNYCLVSISKLLAPVEFVFTGVLLYLLHDASSEDKARAIFNMRRSVRDKHKDIRTNTVICKAMWAFIDNVSNDPSGSHVYQAGSSNAPVEKRGRKRKNNDEDKDEYRPSPVRTLDKGVKTRSKVSRNG